MTDSAGRLAVLALVVALAGALLGPSVLTTGYFTDQEVVNVSIETPGNAPVADAIDSNPVVEGEPVNLTAANSTGDSEIRSYEWDLDGDRTIDAAGMNQTYTYFDQGEYEVTVLITDAAGLVDTATTTVIVENAPPTARAGPDQIVDVDEVVTFNASASTDPGADNLTYEWDVDGDGTVDTTGVSVDHQYRSEGTHNVTLRVSDGDGGVDTDTLSVEAQNVPPTADTGRNLTVVAGEPTLDGSDSLKGDSSDTLTYQWDVDGDDSYDVQGAKPGHYYDETGTYNVTLRVSDGDGGVDTDNGTITVERDTEPPAADVTLDRRSVSDKTVAFDGTGSSDNARIVGYEWTFGDGSSATGPTPTYTYDDPGDYNVTLTVTDSAGFETTTNVSMTIENVPPTADAGANRTVFAGEPLTLDASGSSEGDVSDTLSYEWRFDDGNVTATSEPAVEHIYGENGTYNVTLTVRDGDGGLDTDNVTITVKPDTEPPVVDAVATQTTATNKTIVFNGSGSSDNARIVDYEWTLDDGTTAANSTLSHTYSDPGEYNVTLTVTDSAGYENVTNVSITIENVPPTADAGQDLETVAGTTVTLDGSESTAGDAHDTLSYGWDLDGDGTDEESGPTVDYRYSEAGTYNVTLTVRDGDGGSDTDNVTVTVDPDTQAPVADAGGNQTTTVGQTVQFDGTDSADNVGIVSYEWTFGDGTTAAGPEPDHAYATEGAYEVTLTVRDDAGNVGNDTAIVTAENAEPIADAGPNRTVVTNETVTFDGSTSSDPDGDALTYEWDFDGDGTFETTGQTASYTYTTNGTDTVTLRVSDDDGGVDTDTTAVTVES